jgi:hypothetical protein
MMNLYCGADYAGLTHYKSLDRTVIGQHLLAIISS